MTLARDFGPLALKACRDAMIAHGGARSYINRQIDRDKRMVAWAVANERLPIAVYQALTTVSGLRKGRTAAKEKPPVAPVPDEVVDKTIGHLHPMVAAMVALQRLTGMRPQEVVGIRAADIDMSEPSCWAYRPDRHKTEHHDKDRTVFIGPKAQEVIRPFLGPDDSGYLFSPKRAVAEHSARLRFGRKTKLWPSHAAHQARRKEARGGRADGDCYDVPSYRRAIARACGRAFPHPVEVELADKDLDDARRAELKAWCEANLAELKAWRKAHRWHPNQLRHTAATSIRRRFGLEAAQACLGHSEVGTTQIYAEKNLETARAVMRQIG
jgi:integrase